jgi:hypothetical protein
MDRNKVFTKTQEDLMREHPNYIKAWVKLATRIIRTHKNENKHKTGQRLMMEQYFKWHPPEGTANLTRNKRIKHLKQDIRPD